MHVFGTELIRSLAIWLAESRDYHLYIYKHGPAATDSYCDVTMAHCSHGYLWTHDIEVGASWRDCDNPELFGTWLHHFAYRDRMIHYGILGDQTIYTRFGLICLFTYHFRTPVFQHGASLVYLNGNTDIDQVQWLIPQQVSKYVNVVNFWAWAQFC